MKSLTVMKTTLVEWRKDPALPLAFQLMGEEGMVASVTFPNPQDTLAVVETAEGRWTLKHLGLLNPVTTVREEGATRNMAVFHPHALRHGKLQFTDGAVFDWAHLHDDEPGGAFLDIEGKPMVRIHYRTKDIATPGGPPNYGITELGQPPAARWRHALLAATGWYILLMDRYKEFPEHCAEKSLLI